MAKLKRKSKRAPGTLAEKKVKKQGVFEGMVPEAQQEMESKVLQIVEEKREVTAAQEKVANLEESLADLMEGAKILKFTYRGYTATISRKRRLSVKPAGKS